MAQRAKKGWFERIVPGPYEPCSTAVLVPYVPPPHPNELVPEAERQFARDQIEEAIRTESRPAAIAASLKLPERFVRFTINKIGVEKARRLRMDPDEEKGRQLLILERCTERLLDAIEEGRVVKDKDGRAVLDDDGKILREPAGVGVYRALSVYMGDIRKMGGLDAPTKSVSLDLKSDSLVQPEDMRRVLSDPRARRAMLAIEQVMSEVSGAAPPAIDVTPAPGGDE